MLKGSLQTVALPEVLNFLADTGKSGEFHVSGNRGDGRIWFDQGRISGFHVARAEQPFEAIFELLRIENGEFDFAADVRRPDGVRTADGVGEPVTSALQRAEELFSEWRDIVAVVPSLSHQVRLRTERPSERVTLEPEQWLMVVAIGAGRSVGDVIEARGLQEFNGCKAVRDLVQASLVEVLEPVAEVVEKPVVESFVPPVVEPVAEPVVQQPVVESFVEPVVESTEEPVFEGVAEHPVVDEPSAVVEEDAFTAEELRFGVTEAHQPWEAPTEAHEEPIADSAEPAAFAPYPFGASASESHDGTAETDHYAALRAAMVEIGENLVDETGSSYEEPAHPVYEFQADPNVDGRAALHALLTEVTEEAVSAGSVYDEPVDGLADRGPWTEHELSSMDSARESWAVIDGEEESNIVPFAPVQAMEHPQEVAYSGERHGDEGDEAAPAEEPINRGLLLKFLSSVRN